jgi:hypothetical protein
MERGCRYQFAVAIVNETKQNAFLFKLYAKYMGGLYLQKRILKRKKTVLLRRSILFIATGIKEVEKAP